MGYNGVIFTLFWLYIFFHYILKGMFTYFLKAYQKRKLKKKNLIGFRFLGFDFCLGGLVGFFPPLRLKLCCLDKKKKNNKKLVNKQWLHFLYQMKSSIHLIALKYLEFCHVLLSNINYSRHSFQ